MIYSGFIGIFALLIIAYLLSNNRKAIKFETILWGIGLQIFFGLIILKILTGLIFIYLILKLFLLIVEDKYLSVLLTLSCTFIGFGKISTADPGQMFDGLSLTLVLGSFLLKNSL